MNEMKDFRFSRFSNFEDVFDSKIILKMYLILKLNRNYFFF